MMYRSTREAFAQDRFPAVFGPYRKPQTFLRWCANALLWVLALALLTGMVYSPALVRAVG